MTIFPQHKPEWPAHGRLTCTAVFLVMLLLACGRANGQEDRLDSLNFQMKSKTALDTMKNRDKAEEVLNYDNILHKFNWQLNIIRKNGQVQQINTRRPDSIDVSAIASMDMTAHFRVNPALVGRTIALKYHYSGSVRIMSHGTAILNTGVFNKSKDKDLSDIEQRGFANLELKDSTEVLSIKYIPDSRINSVIMKLKLETLEDAERNSENTFADDQDSYAMGFYYLSFGIVFLLIFLFSTEKTENLYFSLFCLFGAFTFIGFAKANYVAMVLGMFSFVFCLEFMSFFLAKVLRNKNKSRVWLWIKLLVATVCFHPAILFNFSLLGGEIGNDINFNNEPTAPLVILVFGILFGISSSASVVQLMRGFRQKRWEAKIIVAVCSLALFLTFLFPMVASLIPGLPSDLADNLSSVGIYLYPLSAAIVLGRTNRLNQRKLLDQLNSIKKLSDQNLEKEREKQQILEQQNSELEVKVVERTRDIIRQKEELELKKKEIELKNQAITDNINYAQRIQSAILPDIQLIYKALENSFILFMPKDIVSGDFYAFAEKNDRVLIIAGDCTGHGVSGAFMSMIGSSLLNQIINERGIDQPALILNQLNGMVIEALKQGVNESNDGMDVSVCSFDIHRKELQYAGANRPLWLLRDGELMVTGPTNSR